MASEVFGESGGDGLSGVRGSRLIGNIKTPRAQNRNFKRLGLLPMTSIMIFTAAMLS